MKGMLSGGRVSNCLLYTSLVDDHALHLVEHGGVGGVHLVLAVHPAGGDHADGDAVLLHSPDLHGRGLGPQEDLGTVSYTHLDVYKRQGRT